MAKVSMDMPLTNTMGDFSIYKMEGVDKFIIRGKGGPTKEQIANDPQFERLRKPVRICRGGKGQWYNHEYHQGHQSSCSSFLRWNAHQGLPSYSNEGCFVRTW